ncbi:MAG: large ribosomal subunit protein bL35 [Phycisphaerales bacterium]
MPKNKSHKGLLKRIRITKSGKVKLSRAFGRHKKSHKSATLIRGYRSPKYAPAAEAGRIGAMLNRNVLSEEEHQRRKAKRAAEESAAAESAAE